MCFAIKEVSQLSVANYKNQASKTKDWLIQSWFVNKQVSTMFIAKNEIFKFRKKIVDRILKENNSYYVIELTPAIADKKNIEKKFHEMRWMKDNDPEAYKNKNKVASALSNVVKNE